MVEERCPYIDICKDTLLLKRLRPHDECFEDLAEQQKEVCSTPRHSYCGNFRFYEKKEDLAELTVGGRA